MKQADVGGQIVGISICTIIALPEFSVHTFLDMFVDQHCDWTSSCIDALPQLIYEVNANFWQSWWAAPRPIALVDYRSHRSKEEQVELGRTIERWLSGQMGPGVSRAFLLGQSAKLLFFLLSSLLPLSWSFLSVSVFALGMLLSFFILLQLLSISMVIHPPSVVAVGIVAVAGMLFTACCTLLFVRGNTNHNHCRKETTQKHEAWNIYRHVKFVWYHVRLINPDVTMLVG